MQRKRAKTEAKTQEQENREQQSVCVCLPASSGQRTEGFSKYQGRNVAGTAGVFFFFSGVVQKREGGPADKQHLPALCFAGTGSPEQIHVMATRAPRDKKDVEWFVPAVATAEKEDRIYEVNGQQLLL